MDSFIALLEFVQAALVGWVKEEFLIMVLVVVADMVAKAGMDIIVAILLMVVLHMEILIYPVSLVVVVEMIALVVQLLVVVLLVSI
jgi:hypothetical protein